MQSKILNNGNMTGTLHSQPLDLENLTVGSIHAIYAGAPQGTLSLEISNDIIAVSADPAVAVVNWTTYSGSAIVLNAPGQQMYNLANMGYKWCRLSFVPTGGNGTLNATSMVK